MSVGIDLQGRKKLGDFIRSQDYINAKKDGEDGSIGNQLIDLERTCSGDLTFEELKDGYKAFQEKCCVPRLGYRHSPSYWAAYSTTSTLDRLKGKFDDEPESTQLEIGKLEVDCWLALLRAGPNSAHADLMSKFSGNKTANYLQSCQKSDVIEIFKKMRIQFSFDSRDTTVKENTYASIMSDAVRAIFKDLSEEQMKAAQDEFLDLYLHYYRQLPSLSSELKTYVGYIIRDIPDKMMFMMPDGKSRKNPYVGCKNVDTLKTHILALKEILLTCNDDISRFIDILGCIVQAAGLDKLLEPLFECLMDVCVKFAERQTPHEKPGQMYDLYRIKLFKDLKQCMEPTCSVFETCLTSLKALVKQLGDKLQENYFKLIEKMVEECICVYTKITPEQVKSVLDFVNLLLLSGHQKLIALAINIICNSNLGKKFIWKKYLDEVKLFLRTISKQPSEKMFPSRSGDKDLYWLVREYEKFVQKLLDNLVDAKVVTRLCPELLELICICVEEFPEHKANMAYYVSDNKYFTIKKVEPGFLEKILRWCGNILIKEGVPWTSRMNCTIQNLLLSVIATYDGNGRVVTPEQHNGFMSIFKTAFAGDDIDETFYPPGQEKDGGVNLYLLRGVLYKYISLHTATATHACCVDILPDVLKWGKLAEEEDYDEVLDCSIRVIQLFSVNSTKEMAKTLPQIMEFFVNPKHMSDMFSLVHSLYPMNPDPVHSCLQELVDKYDVLKESEKNVLIQILSTVATAHPEVITEQQIGFLFQKCEEGTPDQQLIYLTVLHPVSKRYPEKLQPIFSKLLDDKLFHKNSLTFRALVISCTAGRNEKLNHQAIDYFMNLASQNEPTVLETGLNQLVYMVKEHKDYMQKYKASLEKIEKTATIPEVRQNCHNIIQVLEGRNYEDVFKDLQEQKEFTAELDKKLDMTVDTVITMGDHVTEHHHQLKDVQQDLGNLEEKVDEIDEDLGETKLKVEEIDNKTMTNAPKWSRDLTKLMNPQHKSDWRLLAQRLGYSNDDIRAWSQQHDPCMALLSEWYATHKTSEANFGLLTAMTEMNRMDGAAIVENAMKASEGVVEDEEFEYPSPPPIFLSYQWGMQDEVKLLKQHLNMAGYECWMDIGQMGGGDKLFAKIDNGIRAAKVIICCVTEKYAKSPNCNREVNLSVNLGKPIIPLLMEKMNWPPTGSMGPIFSEYLLIRFFQRGGEETTDNRYWPVPKFQELLMQLNYNVAPDQALIKKEYTEWWLPIVEEIIIDKKKGASKQNSSVNQTETDSEQSPVVFLSYQWGKQPQVKALYQQITSLGYTVWMDIFQMGGGDSLYDKIDKGVRGCKVVVSCMTPKYSMSANCRREVSLADAVKKPIIPLLMEQMKWPPDGPMSMVFTELLYINVYRDPGVQTSWTGDTFDELAMKIKQYVGGGMGSKENTGIKDTNDKKENNAGQEKGVAPRHKADGSQSQTRFVEPKTKIKKPPEKDVKQPSQAKVLPTQITEDKRKIPQVDNARVNYASGPTDDDVEMKQVTSNINSQDSAKQETEVTNSSIPEAGNKLTETQNTNMNSPKLEPTSNNEKPKSKSCAIL